MQQVYARGRGIHLEVHVHVMDMIKGPLRAQHSDNQAGMQ
jgi:hypothetical protein